MVVGRKANSAPRSWSTLSAHGAGYVPHPTSFVGRRSDCGQKSLRVLSNEVKSGNQATADHLGAQFASEAKRHLDLEAGKISLTTVQGLYILFMVSCVVGINRAGAMYRLAALEFLSKLQTDNPLAQPGSEAPGHADQRRALSEACWGIFKMEW